MVRTAPSFIALFCVTLVLGGCGDPDVTHGFEGIDGTSGKGQGTGASGNLGGGLTIGDAGAPGSGVTEMLRLKADKTQVTVEAGEALPEVNVTALLGDVPVQVAWSVDRGELATLSPSVGSKTILTPSGSAGGKVTVIAVVDGQQAQVEIAIELHGTQNGADDSVPGQAQQIATSVGKLTEGGGPGGVGGQGLGVAIDDDDLLAALDDPASDGADLGLRLVYPYDGTVFPRGVLAPLVAWDYERGDADAVKIELSTRSGSFSWSGSFGRPAIWRTRAALSSSTRSRKTSGSARRTAPPARPIRSRYRSRSRAAAKPTGPS